MVKLRTNDRVSIPRAVSKIVERSGEEKKKTDREGREEEKLSLLQVRLRIWKREPRIESFGVQRRIENGTQTSIVPATSGIVKYDRLLVKWDQNIGCRLASILPLAFPSPVPALLPPLLLRRTTRDGPWNDHDDSPFLEIHFRFDWSRSRVFFSLLLPFYQGKVFIYHAFGSIPSLFSRGVFDFSVFLAWSAVWPIQRQNESHHVPVQCPARSRLGFPQLCYERDWNFFQNRLLHDSCTTLIHLDTKRKIFWNNK